jgi:hypothetical protein
MKLLKRPLFCSPEVFARALTQHELSLQNACKRGAGRLSPPTVGILCAQIEGVDEEFGDDKSADATLDDTLNNPGNERTNRFEVVHISRFSVSQPGQRQSQIPKDLHLVVQSFTLKFPHPEDTIRDIGGCDHCNPSAA